MVFQWSANSVSDVTGKIFQQLFVEGTKDEVAAEIRDLQRGKSILDTVLRDAQRLNQSLGGPDRQKLDEYFSSVRELENRIQQNENWFDVQNLKSMPKIPKDIEDKNDVLARQKLMYSMMALALQTDSTRVITLTLVA